ncbi:MAG: zonular occludens toxin domain-containing protein [Nitrospirales bacterium]
MIELLEGVPGSGKSYYAVSERLLKWVRAGRRVYVFVDGFYLDRLALFEGRHEAELEQQITIWHSGEDVKTGLLHVEPGSAVLIDEVQTVFRSKDKTDPALLRWLETHRHRGIDLVLMCQQYGQVTLGVNRLVEATTKFRRLDRFGLKNRYQAPCGATRTSWKSSGCSRGSTSPSCTPTIRATRQPRCGKRRVEGPC